MADDKNQRGSQDLNRINLNEPYEVKYWTKIFGVSEEELRDAVRRVGAGQSLLDPKVTARVLERLRKGPDEDERLKGITAQERRILNFLADGMTNRQIAEEMFLAEKTIKNYVSNLLTKMGMSRRTEAAVYAARQAARKQHGA